MPELPWYAVEESSQRFKDTRMLKWVYCINMTPLSWEGPGNTFFIMIMRKRFGRGAPVSLNCSVVALLCRSEITVGTVLTELGSLSAMWIMGPRVAVARVALKCQRQCGHGYSTGQWDQSSSQNNPTGQDLRNWLVDVIFSRKEIDGQPTKFLPDLCK